MKDWYDESSDLTDVFVGRKIVSVRPGNGEEGDEGYLVLDDGTEVEIIPNHGCGGCGSGWYAICHLGTVDNVITAVRTEVTPTDESAYPEDYRYEIFVIADNTQVNIATIEGSDGNGYYGSGYSLTVKARA